MTPYQWTTDNDEVALDAIIVGIGSDERAFTAAGIEYGEVLASIYWPEWISQGDKIKVSLEGRDGFQPWVASRGGASDSARKRRPP